MSDQMVSRLKQVPLFDKLGRRELKALADASRLETYRAGQVLVRQGQTTGRLFVLTKGRVKVDIDGSVVEVEQAGEVIGELSILARTARTATVTAETDVEALSLSSTTFMVLLQEEWDITRRILETLARRLYEVEHRIGS